MKSRFCFFVTALVFACSIAFSQDSLSLYSDKGYPVVSYLDTLFYIKNRLGPLSAKERTQLTTNKIQKLEKDLTVKPDSIHIDTINGLTNIVYQDLTLVSVTQSDADSLQTNRTELAQFYSQEIINNIKKYRRETNLAEIGKRVAFGLLIILALAIIIALINRNVNKFKNWLSLKIQNNLDGFKFRGYEILTKETELLILRKLINMLKFLVIGLSVYLTLPLIFRLFPWTKAWSDRLIEFVLKPLGNILQAIINFIPDLISIVVIAVVFNYVIKAVKFLAGEIESGKLAISGFYSDWAQPTYNIIRFILYAFMVVVIWPFLPGSDSEIFKGVSVFIGLLVSFGSSSAIGNIVAGLVITYMRPFRLNDRVKIGDTTGDVIEKTLLVTRIKTIKNEIITIPNSAILSGNTVNYSSLAENDGYIIHTTVTIGYDVPWRQVHELLTAAASETDGVNPEKKPFVLQTSLEDWYVSYQINAYTRQPQKSAVIYSSLYQNIQDKFNEAGVEIMSPHYHALREGNQTTIPADYLPQDYVPSPFKVENVNVLPDEKKGKS